MDYSFVPKERALIIGGYLVVADLHIGYEQTLEERGINIPNSSNGFILRLKEMARISEKSKLIILGDIKHNITKITSNELYDIPNFFYKLSEIFKEIIIIKGNHDGWIEKMTHPKNIHILDEFRYGDILLIHGHKWPSKESMIGTKHLILAHSHPSFYLVDIHGRNKKMPCWKILRPKRNLKDKYPLLDLEEAILVPPFNTFLHGTEEVSGVFSKYLKEESVLLLDLTKIK